MKNRGQRQRSQMEKQLATIMLDAPARIGTMVFHKGVSVLELVLQAQSDFLYRNGPLEEKAPTVSAADPWVRAMYQLTTDYNLRTGLKVAIADLLEAFFVEGIKQVEEDDRPAFERRLRERLA